MKTQLLLAGLLAGLVSFGQQNTSTSYYRKGTKVEINKDGAWVRGEIEKVSGKVYKVHYDGTTHAQDELLSSSRIRGIKTEEKPVVPAPQKGPDGYATGDLVIVEIHVPNEATILEMKDGKYKVHYEDVDRDDAWVTADKIKPFDAGDTKAGPPPGRYVCYYTMYEYTYMGTFIIPAKGSYQYETGLKGKGAYTYDPATRKVTWKSGDLAGKTLTTTYYNTKQNGPLLEVIFPKGKRAGDKQNCLCKERF